MATKTITNWREIELAASEKQAAKKHRYSIRKYSILDIAWFWIRGAIVAAALCVVIGAAGNSIEFLARM